MVESTGNSITNRLMGVITYKAPVYREIADDRTATGQAATILIVVALIVGLGQGALRGGANAGTTIIGSAIANVIGALIGWYIVSWVLAWVSKQFFQGKTDTGEMLRVTGYAYVFNIIGIISILGLVALILYLIAFVIGIREAAEVSTGQAVGTAIIAWIAL